MAENKDFCLFSIGQPESSGCFCPSNTLLKNVIESISKDFDIVLIDCEAGLEQINRSVIETVDILLIVTDISLRSLETANSIRKSARKFTKYKKLGVVINKAKNNVEITIKKPDFEIKSIYIISPDINGIEYIDHEDLGDKIKIILPKLIIYDLWIRKNIFEESVSDTSFIVRSERISFFFVTKVT